MNEAFHSGVTLVWQNQTVEHATPSEPEIRSKVQRLQMKVRRSRILALAIGIVLLIACAISVVNLHYTISRLIAAMMIFPVSVSIYRTVKSISSPQGIEDEATSPCLEFHRNHVREHHRAVIVKWQLLVPMMLFLWFGVTFIGRSFLILRVLFPSLLVLILLLRQWEIRKLRRHLAALDDFENGGQDL
jgi:hypothetical protein